MINNAALDKQTIRFLKTRRSHPAKTICEPAPSREELEHLLTMAARTPDHGGLIPWRFIILRLPALKKYAAALPQAGKRSGIADDKIDKAVTVYNHAPLVVAVISSPVESDKVPQNEQVYSAAAVCLSLVNAALASGFAAAWVSGWHSHDPIFCQEQLGIAPFEKVVGLIHIGTPGAEPVERPRPDITKLTTWLD